MSHRILIVDDSMSARFFLKKCLPIGDLDIREAVNGEEAVALYTSFRPEITFMDLTMPVMDGFEALVAIREIDPKAIVIVLSADIQQQTQDRVAQFGAFSFLKKPPRKDAVIATLRQALAKRPSP